MDLIECGGCGELIVLKSARCWRCGRAVVTTLSPARLGLGVAAQSMVMIAVFAVVLVGMVALTQRQQLVNQHDAASAAAIGLAEREQADADRRAAEAALGSRRTPTPAPARPDAAGPGTYTVQRGDSLFSVAASTGLSPNELIFWNKEEYPTLQSTPALNVGWVLKTSGPPLPTPTPRATADPRPPATPEPQVAGPPTTLPSFGPDSFPASSSVTVSYYAVSGSTPHEIHASIQANGPWSGWLGRNAQAHVQVRPSFNFSFRGDGYGNCSIVPSGLAFVTISYEVRLPAWDPPVGVSTRTVDWWTETIHETVAHESHHITLYESYRSAMHDAVASGTCHSVEADLTRLFNDARRANCEFDLAEYGYAVGLTLESCMAS